MTWTLIPSRGLSGDAQLTCTHKLSPSTEAEPQGQGEQGHLLHEAEALLPGHRPGEPGASPPLRARTQGESQLSLTAISGCQVASQLTIGEAAFDPDDSVSDRPMSNLEKVQFIVSYAILQPGLRWVPTPHQQHQPCTGSQPVAATAPLLPDPRDIPSGLHSLSLCLLGVSTAD